jgi:hypothetical protein
VLWQYFVPLLLQCIELANAAGRDLWVNIPGVSGILIIRKRRLFGSRYWFYCIAAQSIASTAHATDGYITQFAQLLFERTDPSLMIYYE